MGRRGAEGQALGLGEREQARAHVALAADRVCKSSPRPDRISISLEISSPAIASASTGSSRVAASRRTSKRGTRSSVAGVEEHELLLEAHGEVRGPGEAGHGAVEVERHVR